MSKYSIKQYQSTDYNNWNTFISGCKNATFLFHRDFMEYHSDRFEDYSLIVLDGEKWVAVLPANIVDNEVHSHQGLTYGGLLYKQKLKLVDVISAFKNVLQYLNSNNIEKLFIKTVPSIYHQQPAEELQYALFLIEAKLTKRDSFSVIDLNGDFKISSGRKEGIKKGEKSNLTVKETVDFKPFWDEILIPNMLLKYKTNPTHSLSEITLLHNYFPKNIRQFNVYDNDKIVAGTTIFESETVAHAQYIFGDESKSINGSLDFLYNHLILNVFKNKKYLDFGSSNGYLGNKLDVNLTYWKQSFGASTIVHDFYQVETTNFAKLELS